MAAIVLVIEIMLFVAATSLFLPDGNRLFVPSVLLLLAVENKAAAEDSR
jgi:hypothetical protein